MNRTLKLIENGVEVKTYYSFHNDYNDSGLTDDFQAFIAEVEAKKQVKVDLNPDARTIGEQVGKNIRNALLSTPEKSYSLGVSIGKKLAGRS